MAGKGPSGRERPVLLVHGILGQRHLYWNLFAARLKRDGFRVHEAQLPYSMLGDIRIAARTLQEKIEATCKGDKVDQVDIVCHSAGGLVARYYIKFLEGHKRVHHLVLLGTPHKGTYFSFVLPLLRIANQAKPGSNLIREIDEAEAPDVPITNFWSPVDGIVIPAENAQLSGPHVRDVKVDWMHHWGFLVSEGVYRKVRDALAGKPPAPAS
jgi:triacylglycerol esterase/lipase EstA (alpha/beta hydrolase family)